MSTDITVVDDESGVPDFITRVDINKMNDEALDAMIEAIRMRRMTSFMIYTQTQEDLRLVGEGKARVKLEKEVEMVYKLLETLDKNIDKLELRVNKLRGLRIQAGLAVL